MIGKLDKSHFTCPRSAFRKLRLLKDFFLLFLFWMFLIYMRGVLAECSLGAWWARFSRVTRQASWTAEDDAPDAKVETHCMELMLQVCLGSCQAG